MAAVAYAVVPASAAKMAGGSGENLAKTESMIEAMTEGEGKMMAQKEIAQAQDAMLNGKTRRLNVSGFDLERISV